MTLPAEQRPGNYQAMIESVLEKCPLEGDDTENETIMKFVFKLWQSDQPTVQKYMANIAKTCIKILCDEKCADQMKKDFKKQIGQFITTVVVPNGQTYLQELEAQLNEFEKKELQKYIAQ